MNFKPARFLQPNALQICLVAIFTLGTVTVVALALAALFAISYLLNLTVSAIAESMHHIAVLYSGSDSLTKVIILLLGGWCLFKLARSAVCSLRKK